MNLDPEIFGATPLAERLCTVSGCDRPHFGHGYCQGHHVRWKRGKPVDGPLRIWRPRTSGRPPCVVRHCTRPQKANTHKLCAGHARRKRQGRKNWDGPLATYRPMKTTREVRLRITRAANQLLAQEARRRGLHAAELMRRVLEEHSRRLGLE